jgi:phenylalanyl-tRNA synthetase beta chain
VNNLVDIANLVMLQSGQPFHVFDYDKLLNEKEIIIRHAIEGEIITTLQGQKLVLSSEDIVINSGKKIIDLAGIIGSRDTAITSQTKNVLIECASFNPQTIKKTASLLNIPTAASVCFSRRVSLIFSPKQILSRVITFIINSYQGDLNSGELIVYKEERKKETTIIAISQSFIEKKIGQTLSEPVIENI